MTNANPIELELNLLQYKTKLKSSEDYLNFWNGLADALQGHTLVAGKTHFIETPQNGKIGLRIISVPRAFSVVTQETNFAIHSVLERPDIRYKCFVCRSYGPFRCSEQNCKNRLCDQHVVILDGNMRAYCPNHAPVCRGSGGRAIFWCDGPRCRGRMAWSEQYRVQHPNDADHWYCRECYALQFPTCSSLYCHDTGTTRCEHVNPSSGESCNRSLCNRHVKRWQIYGPHKLGVALCSEHANIKRLSESEILYQMVAVTTQRLSRWHRSGFISLPSLMSIRHIFINAKNEIVNPDVIDQRLAQLRRDLAYSSGKLSQDMARMIERSGSKRKRELSSFDNEQGQGRAIFARLVAVLRTQGKEQLADNLRFADYRPRHKLLFVHLDEQYRGAFIGRSGSNIKPLQDSLGVRIQFEDK